MHEDALNPEVMRRKPQQARAIKRVNKILAAAEGLFAEVGYEAASTNAIAARAQTSIGSLYRFFPDKEALLKALAERYIEQMHETFSQVHHSPEVLDLPLSDYIDRIMREFEAFIRANPGYRAVFVESLAASASVQAMDADLCSQVAEELAEFYRRKAPHLSRDQTELMALVVVEVARNLRRLSLTRDAQFQQQVAGELKKLLLAYLQPYLGK